MKRVARKEPAPRALRSLAVALGALLVLAPLARDARAQISPMGAHNATLGPGAGVTSPVSPTGGFAASVPLLLPSARGGVPVPLSVNYTAGPRVGAAGSGWDVPLSYVRLSDSIVRRKPAIDNTAGTTTEIPERIVLSLGGATTVMVRRADDAVWIPAVSDAYEELAPASDGWELRTSGGLVYTFTNVRTIAQGPVNSPPLALVGTTDPPVDPSLLDPDLWLLTSVHDVGEHDTVNLYYSLILPSCTYPSAAPEIDLVGLSYGRTASGNQALYQIGLGYEAITGAHCVGYERDLFPTGRDRFLTKITVRASNNLVSDSAMRRIRRYDLTYTTDGDTELPRLQRVAMLGEDDGGADAPVTLATYSYAATTHAPGTDHPTVTYGPGVAVNRDYHGAPVNLFAMSRTDISTYVGGTYPPWSCQSPECLWFGSVEVNRTHHVIRDFTGDGIPDLVFKDDGGTWHLVAGRLDTTPLNPTPHPALDGPEYTWNDFPEIFEQQTFRPDISTRPLRKIGIVSMTLIEFVDWNGDGRMDVIDARHSSDIDHWRVWENQGLDGAHVKWRSVDVPIAQLRNSLQTHGVATQQTLLGHYLLDFASGGVEPLHDILPLERSRSWPENRSSTCTTYNGSVGTPGCLGVPDTAESWQQDTFSEWSLRDVNGDGYPDFTASGRSLVECESNPISGPGCPGPDHPPTWTGICQTWHLEMMRERSCPANGMGAWDPAPPSSTPPDAPFALINTMGALDPGPFDGFVPPMTSSWRFPGISLEFDAWVNGVGDMSNPNQPFNPTPSLEWRGLDDLDGDGLVDAVGNGLSGVGQARFNSDRTVVCAPGKPGGSYVSEQVAGLADLNGDGLPDWVEQEPGSSTCANGHCTPYDGNWSVRFGDGNGFTLPHRLVGPFALSSTTGSCAAGPTVTTAGLLDVDGDGKPEYVRVVDFGMVVSSINVVSDAGPDVPGGLASGRLVSITNGDGATTTIDYFNNKANSVDPADQRLPFPEIVVSGLRTDVHGVGDPVAPRLFAYGKGHLQYDPYFARWTFPGYEREISLVAAGSNPAAVVGTMVVTDKQTSVMTPQVWTEIATGGRPEIVSVLEGTFIADPRYMLTVAVDGDSHLRSQTVFAYGFHPLGTADGVGPHEECFGTHAEIGGWPAGDTALCKRAGIVYVAGTTHWEGVHSPAAGKENVASASSVDVVDEVGRPLKITAMGDTRRTDDDLCISLDWATAPAGDRVTSVLRGEHVTDCGWTFPGPPGLNGLPPGTPITVAGVRFAYDGMPEGQFSRGRLTKRTVERYDVNSGAPMGEHVADTYAYDTVGNVIEDDRSRIQNSALQSTVFTYDPWAATPISTTVMANGAPPLLTTSSVSVWPSKPASETDVNGEVHTVERDHFGRARRATTTGVGGNKFVVAQNDYVDTPGARSITTTSYLGDAKDDGTPPSGIKTRTTIRFDVLGRAALSWRELGSDYGGVLASVVRFDPLGRVVYSADPFPAQAPPAFGAAGGDGVSFFYDGGGRLVGEVRAPQQTTSLTLTDRANDVFTTTHVYEWRDGLAYLTTRNADDNDPQSPILDKIRPRTELASTALGRVVQSARLEDARRLDLAQYGVDRLGHPSIFARFAKPDLGTDPVIWTDSYDSLGARLQHVEPGLATTTFAYDDWGELTSTTWYQGWKHEVTNTYDGLGRPTQRLVTAKLPISPPIVKTESKETYAYDSIANSQYQTSSAFLGRLSSASADQVGTVYYDYDAFGGAAGETWVHADENKPFATRTTTTAGGLLSSIAYTTPEGNDVATYAYDSAGRVRTVNFGGVDVFKTGAIDALGRYRQVQLGNGVVESYDYRDHGHRELTSATVSTSGGSLVRKPTAYDALGRVLTLDQTGSLPGGALDTHDAYSYDALGHLAHAVKTGTSTADDTYVYDWLGNQLSHVDAVQAANSRSFVAQPGDPDRLCYVGGYGTTGACNVTYDGAGNVISLGGGARTFTYDGGQRVTSMKAGIDAATFAYGPGDALVREVRTHGTGNTRTIRHYGALVRAENNTNGATYIERTLEGPLGAIATVRGTGASRLVTYVHGDEQANRLFTDKTGAVTEVATAFEPFGAAHPTFGTPGSLSWDDHLWNGGESADPFGVVILGARPYEPSLGRFLQRDPLINGGGASQTNPYAFAWNDPINLTDPSGLSPAAPCLFGNCVTANSGPTAFDMSLAAGAAWTFISALETFGGGAHPAVGVGVDDSVSTGLGNMFTDPLGIGSVANIASQVAPPGAGDAAVDGLVDVVTYPLLEKTEESLWYDAKGAYQIVRHPRQTLDGLLALGRKFGANPYGTLWEVVKSGCDPNCTNLFVGALLGEGAGWVASGARDAIFATELSYGADAAGSGFRSLGAMAAPGYRSFGAFKRAYGRAGIDREWHHIVEQTSGNIARFGAERIQWKPNLRSIPEAAHREISAYYSSIQPFTSGKTVREWLSSQSYEAQYKFGMDAIGKFGGPWPGM